MSVLAAGSFAAEMTAAIMLEVAWILFLMVVIRFVKRVLDTD